MVRKLSHLELVARQNQMQSRIPLCVVLNNIRSLYNVGSIFRTADGVGLEKIWLCGITGIPPDSKIAKTALGADKVIPWEYRRDAGSLIKELKNQGYHIVLLEQTHQSIPYYHFIPSGPTCLVLGNEIEGICDSIAEYCETAIEIEMAGLKNSLNVTVAFGVIAYHFRRSFLMKVETE